MFESSGRFVSTCGHLKRQLFRKVTFSGGHPLRFQKAVFSPHKCRREAKMGKKRLGYLIKTAMCDVDG